MVSPLPFATHNFTDVTIVSMMAGTALLVDGIRQRGTSDSRKPFLTTFARKILACPVKIDPHANALFNLCSLLFSVTFHLCGADCLMAYLLLKKVGMLLNRH